jgi:membrane protein DedA with SNARE-associated domain
MTTSALIANIVLDALLIVEGTGMPGVPFEPAFIWVAFLITKGQSPFWLSGLLAGFSNLLGNVIGYLIGKKLGPEFVLKLRFLRMEPDDIDELQKFTNRYGSWVVVISRWFGPIRTPTILLSGTFGMDLLRYTLFSSIGAFSWCFALLWANWQGSKLLLMLLGANSSGNWLLAMLIGWGLAFVSLTVIMRLWHWYKRRGNSTSVEEDPNNNVNNDGQEHTQE